MDRHDQLLLNSKLCFSSTPSLAGTQLQQHLHFHQQALRVRIRSSANCYNASRVQLPMLHVSSNISCDYVTNISCEYVTCLAFFATCVTPEISCHPHPEGEPCIYVILYARHPWFFITRDDSGRRGRVDREGVELLPEMP